jgi:uncharacterized membrane protein (UPF0127 family)
MPRWLKPVIVVLAIIVGGTILWWQMNAEQSLLRLDGHSYHFTVMRTDAELQKGLSGTPSLPAGQAMVFAFANDGPQVMWMKDMKYPIDMIWLNDDKQVVHTVKNIQPSTYNSADPTKSQKFQSDTPAHYVIELPSGTIDSTGIKNGDPAGLPSGV